MYYKMFSTAFVLAFGTFTVLSQWWPGFRADEVVSKHPLVMFALMVNFYAAVLCCLGIFYYRRDTTKMRLTSELRAWERYAGSNGASPEVERNVVRVVAELKHYKNKTIPWLWR